MVTIPLTSHHLPWKPLIYLIKLALTSYCWLVLNEIGASWIKSKSGMSIHQVIPILLLKPHTPPPSPTTPWVVHSPFKEFKCFLSQIIDVCESKEKGQHIDSKAAQTGSRKRSEQNEEQRDCQPNYSCLPSQATHFNTRMLEWLRHRMGMKALKRTPKSLTRPPDWGGGLVVYLPGRQRSPSEASSWSCGHTHVYFGECLLICGAGRHM